LAAFLPLGLSQLHFIKRQRVFSLTWGLSDMSENPIWPAYQIGSHETIYAIGVASIKFAQLEYAMGAIFRTVLDINHDDVSVFIAQTRNYQTLLQLLSAKMNSTYYPEEVREKLEAFVKGFKICTDNRNLLMHSNINASLEDAIMLHKANKDGRIIACRPTIEELRQVADDMNAYFHFGVLLANAVASHGGDYANPPALPFPWPDIPPRPKLLDYKSLSLPEGA
jgi:hypothetical protein